MRGDGRKADELRDTITAWVNFWLDAAANPGGDSQRLHINEGKTEVTPFRLMDGQVGVTSRMALIQSELSGPADMESLEQATTGLDALLTLADRLDGCGMRSDGDQEHPLARIASHRSEVRDDTIKRYAAGRLVKVLRQRRSMTDLDTETEPGLTCGEAIDHEMEMFARKQIRAWSHDASMVLVLRYAMDLYPSPALLRPVIEALRGLITGRKAPQVRVGWYICADLLRMLLQAGRDAGAWSLDDPEFTAVFLFGGIHSVADDIILGKKRASRTRLVQRLQTHFLRSVGLPEI